MKVVDNVCKILPVTKIIVETASFDIQKIKNPEISGVDYQQNDQLNFWNLREYVLLGTITNANTVTVKVKTPF